MLISGSVSGYVKSLSLKAKAKQKVEEQTQAQSMKSEYQRQAEEQKEKMQVASIEGKLRSGKRLSNSDLDYLKEKSPDLYKEAVEAEQQRRDYERRLRACKTKEEVQRLNASVNMSFASQVKAIKTSNMSRSEKVQAMAKLQFKQAAVQDSHVTFVGSRDYAQLPSEEEEKKKKKAQQKTGTVDTQEVLPKNPEEEKKLADLIAKAEQEEKTDATKDQKADSAATETEPANADPAPTAPTETASLPTETVSPPTETPSAQATVLTSTYHQVSQASQPQAVPTHFEAKV